MKFDTVELTYLLKKMQTEKEYILKTITDNRIENRLPKTFSIKDIINRLN